MSSREWPAKNKIRRSRRSVLEKWTSGISSLELLRSWSAAKLLEKASFWINMKQDSPGALMDNECEILTCKKVKYCVVEDRYWKSENPKFRLLELSRFWSAAKPLEKASFWINMKQGSPGTLVWQHWLQINLEE